MRPLEEINQANGSDGKPMLDTAPGRTAGMPDLEARAQEIHAAHADPSVPPFGSPRDCLHFDRQAARTEAGL